MTKELYVFSDTELGGGTITDDFAADGLLIQLIDSFAKSENEVELIFNGDTFDFLKCPIIRKRFTFYLNHITASISLEKLDYIYNAHKGVFNAMKRFLTKDKKSIVFIFGNHDYELLFPEVQAKMKELLDNDKISFKVSYFENRIHIEHGHMHDVFFSYSPKKLFRLYKDKKELNIPVIFSGFGTYFMDTKELHPFVERIDDRINLAKVYPQISSKMVFLAAKFFVHQILFSIYSFFVRGYIWRYFSVVFNAMLSIVKGRFDVDGKDLFRAVKKLPKTAKVIIFGHVHEKVSELKEKTKQRVFVLDTWRDEYSFSDNLRYLVPKTKRYAKVFFDNDKIKVTLFDFSAKGGKLLFEKVLEDEAKVCQKIYNERESSKISDYDIEETNYTII